MITVAATPLLLLLLVLVSPTSTTANQSEQQQQQAGAPRSVGSFEMLQLHSNAVNKSKVISGEIVGAVTAKKMALAMKKATFESDGIARGQVLMNGGSELQEVAQMSDVNKMRVKQKELQKQMSNKLLATSLRMQPTKTKEEFSVEGDEVEATTMATLINGNSKLVAANYTFLTSNSTKYKNFSGFSALTQVRALMGGAKVVERLEKQDMTKLSQLHLTSAISSIAELNASGKKETGDNNGSRAAAANSNAAATKASESQSSSKVAFLWLKAMPITARTPKVRQPLTLSQTGNSDVDADAPAVYKLRVDDGDGDGYGNDSLISRGANKVANTSFKQMSQFVRPASTVSMATTTPTTITQIVNSTTMKVTSDPEVTSKVFAEEVKNGKSSSKVFAAALRTSESATVAGRRDESLNSKSAMTVNILPTISSSSAEGGLRADSVKEGWSDSAEKPRVIQTVSSKDEKSEQVGRNLKENKGVQPTVDNNNLERRLARLKLTNTKPSFNNENAKSAKSEKPISAELAALTDELTMPAQSGNEQAEQKHFKQNDLHAVGGVRVAHQASKGAKQLADSVQGGRQRGFPPPQQSISKSQMDLQRGYTETEAMYLVHTKPPAQESQLITHKPRRQSNHLEQQSDHLPTKSKAQQIPMPLEGEVAGKDKYFSQAPNAAVAVQIDGLNLAEKRRKMQRPELKETNWQSKPREEQLAALGERVYETENILALNELFFSKQQTLKKPNNQSELAARQQQQQHKMLFEAVSAERKNPKLAKVKNKAAKSVETFTKIGEQAKLANNQSATHGGSTNKSLSGTNENAMPKLNRDKSTDEAKLWQKTRSETEFRANVDLSKQAVAESAGYSQRGDSKRKVPEELQRALKYANKQVGDDEPTTTVSKQRAGEFSVAVAAESLWRQDEKQLEQKLTNARQSTDFAEAQSKVNNSAEMQGIHFLNKTNMTERQTLFTLGNNNSKIADSYTNTSELKAAGFKRRPMIDSNAADTKAIGAKETLLNAKEPIKKSLLVNVNYSAKMTAQPIVEINEHEQENELAKNLPNKQLTPAITPQMEERKKFVNLLMKPQNCTLATFNDSKRTTNEMAAQQPAVEEVQLISIPLLKDDSRFTSDKGNETRDAQRQTIKQSDWDAVSLPLPLLDYNERTESETMADWQQRQNRVAAYIRRPDMRTGEALKLNATLFNADGEVVAKEDANDDNSKAEAKEKAPTTSTTTTATVNTMLEEMMSARTVSHMDATTIINLDVGERLVNGAAAAAATEAEINANNTHQLHYAAPNVNATNMKLSKATHDNATDVDAVAQTGASAATMRTNIDANNESGNNASGLFNSNRLPKHNQATEKPITTIKNVTTGTLLQTTVTIPDTSNSNTTNATPAKWSPTTTTTAVLADTTSNNPKSACNNTSESIIGITAAGNSNAAAHATTEPSTVSSTTAKAAVTATIATSLVSKVMNSAVKAQPTASAATITRSDWTAHPTTSAATITHSDWAANGTQPTGDTTFFLLPTLAGLTSITTPTIATQYALMSTAAAAASASAAAIMSTPTATSTTAAAGAAWPVKHASVMEGDVILGGLMMVHSREDSITCGPIMPQGGIQALEAMLYTLDQVNKQQLLPNVTLGAHILDDCDKDTYGLEMAVDFIKDGNYVLVVTAAAALISISAMDTQQGAGSALIASG
ncbi:PREDICTED: uncharacterized protein LOC108362783 [Rhagoletis zephyria]|uniref:uncharacterized protein LOC108362783 n=1 Tax=Rhagoletis zephyria TaxID=28612 RepID=UPI00081122E3|nr:PREDICTED: uncharacterized protein LOC108362783 [Rhagoletis zephyria]